MSEGNHKPCQLNKKTFYSRVQQFMLVFFFSLSDMNNWYGEAVETTLGRRKTSCLELQELNKE